MKDNFSIQLRVDVVFFQIPQNLSVVPHDIETKPGIIKGIFKTVRVNQLTIGWIIHFQAECFRAGLAGAVSYTHLYHGGQSGSR